jgi:naphtho-gamma-pyrone polyketide synthase
VGHSGRFPDAASTEKFWDLLHKGLDVHREIPKDRFDAQAHYDPTSKKRNTSRIQHGCFIEEPGLFDARFFNMSPRESCQADPGQRLAITTAYEAMEMAGFVPDRTPFSQRDRIGIFYGMTSDDWREVNSGQNVDTYFIPGGNRAPTPGRINYHFKFSGPSFSIDTACSSSFAAIHTACNSLWRGDCDTAIAGRTNVMTNPDNFAGLDRGHFLSTTGNCNAFDDSANGYCRADAVGTVILKRLEDAEADKDPIYGVLLGAYTNHSAEADSMTRPHVGAQAFIFNKMLNQANVNPLDVSYIEMHGIGTQAGDAVEMKSVLEVFAKSPRGAEHPLHLGSAKANVGHAESASGVTSLIKVLKMMEKSEIPPHCGIKTKINHGFPTDLKARNVNIALSPTAWRRPENGKRTVFLNNFSAAGGNTALLMEDAPVRAAPGSKDGRSSHIVAISAKSISSLDRNIQSMIQFIDNMPDLPLPALSYTTTDRRMHHNHRIIVTGHDIAEVKWALQNLGPSKDIRPIQATNVPNVAFAFTGQGCLYSGMAKTFFDSVSQFRSDIQRFDRIAQNLGFPTFLPLVDGIRNVDELGSVVSQVGAASVQMALSRLWTSWGVFPSTVTGHSLGKYAALNAVGVLSASDTIYLTGARAQLLEKYCTMGTHSMLAVKASPVSLNKYLSGRSCEIACINGPEESVLSGSVSEIRTHLEDLTAAGFQCVKLDVPFAFHSA